MIKEQETNLKPDAALIYCRVSDKKQEKEGTGLETQEHRCRERARQLGCEVEAIFPDTMTGGGDFMKRPGMVALLAYLKAQRGKTYVVIFDDMKRFARDVEFYRKIRRTLKQYGALVHCLNFKIEETPEGKFIETIIAAQGELEREQNARQVIQKMTARVEQGFFVFRALPGYRYVRSKRGGKELVRDEPLASILSEALAGYACGRFQTQAEVRRFLESKPTGFPRNRNGEIHSSRVENILRHPVYAGYVEAPNWGVPLTKGRHEALISFAEHQKIQDRLKTGGYAPARKDFSTDFPLRGFVRCGDCREPLTAAWSKGRSKKYPYYLCDTRDCGSYRKSIPRAKIEGAFADLVRALQPTQDLMQLARAMFTDAWDQRAAQAKHLLDTLKVELRDTEKQIETLLGRLVESDSPRVIAAYERKVDALERDKLVIAEKLENGAAAKGTFEEFIEPALAFLANPWKLWDSGNYMLKRLVVRLAFPEGPAYCRKNGYRTVKTAFPFKALSHLKNGNFEMVVRLSIELSP